MKNKVLKVIFWIVCAYPAYILLYGVLTGRPSFYYSSSLTSLIIFIGLATFLYFKVDFKPKPATAPSERVKPSREKIIKIIFFVTVCLSPAWYALYGGITDQPSYYYFKGVGWTLPWIIVVIVLAKHLFKSQPKKVQEAAPERVVPKVTDWNNAMFLKDARDRDIILGNPTRGVLVIGGAGSGKSVSVVRQLIAGAASKKWCGLVYDFKYPTLTDELHGWIWQHNGNTEKHFNINFSDPTHSHRVNPLNPSYVKNASYAREFALSIIQNLIPESVDKMDFWTRSCTDLLTAEIHFMAQEYPHLSTLPHIIALNFLDEDKLIPLLSTNLECLGMVKGLETAMRNKAQNQLSGVISTLQSALSRINTPEIFWLLSGDDFSLNLNDPDDPKWLSIGNVPDLADTFAPVISLIITVAMKQLNQPGKHSSIVVLDEAPTIFIPNIERIPATARSNRVAFVYCAQDMSQIEKAYGKVSMDAILGNLNNQFFGRLSSPKTAEHVSKMFGKDDFSYTSESSSSTRNPEGGQSVGSSTSESLRERDRVRPQQLLSFDPGQFAIFLVESNLKEGIRTLKILPALNMGRLETYPEIDFKGNFRLIYDQVKEMIASAALKRA